MAVVLESPLVLVPAAATIYINRPPNSTSSISEIYGPDYVPESGFETIAVVAIDNVAAFLNNARCKHSPVPGFCGQGWPQVSAHGWLEPARQW